MENKDIERIRASAIDAALTIHTDNRTRSVYSDGYKHGAMAENKHLQPEIQRLKGLIEEAWNKAYVCGTKGEYRQTKYEQFKQKHGL